VGDETGDADNDILFFDEAKPSGGLEQGLAFDVGTFIGRLYAV
jgi:hypothetical protein